MASKLVATGQVNLVDEVSGVNQFGFNLAEVLKSLTGIQKITQFERQLVVGDGDVSVNLGGVATVRAFLIYVVGVGEITVKHDANTAGILCTGLVLFGTIGSIIISTAETQAVTVKLLAVQ